MDDETPQLDIEKIKLLKARYCRYLDTKNWRAWRELFADEFLSEIVDSAGQVIVGADEFVAYTRRTIGKWSQATVHYVHAPEMALTSPMTAQGIWALNDAVDLLPMVTLRGFGHYHETYEKIDGQWRLTSSRLTRLREDIVTPLLSLHNARWLRTAAARLARHLSRVD
jgi:hypothetical protein